MSIELSRWDFEVMVKQSLKRSLREYESCHYWNFTRNRKLNTDDGLCAHLQRTSHGKVRWALEYIIKRAYEEIHGEKAPSHGYWYVRGRIRPRRKLLKYAYDNYCNLYNDYIKHLNE